LTKPAKKAKKKQEKKVAESAEVKKAPVPIKEKTPEERKLAYTQGIIKTAVASFIGVIAGFIAVSQFGTAEDTKWFAVLVIIGALSYYAQRLIYPALKINTKEFGFKDWFYVEFLVIDFCLVTWTMLLN
jgi:hypothetical protein